jgi:hypothetical protein
MRAVSYTVYYISSALQYIYRQMKKRVETDSYEYICRCKSVQGIHRTETVTGPETDVTLVDCCPLIKLVLVRSTSLNA